MINLCVEFHTVTPLEPLSWRDLIYLSEFRKEDARSRDLLQKDIRAILFNILGSLGGGGDSVDNWMPSSLHLMAKRYEQLQKG